MRGLLTRIGEVYLQVFRVYRAWWKYILPLAVIILVPIDFLDSWISDEMDGLGSGRFEEILALLVLGGALAWTSLLGQVFMAGTIGLSLIHTKDGKPPRLAWMARHISYGKLIAVDLLYLLIVLVGAVLLAIPGLLAFVFFGLAGPVVEIEDRSVKGAFKRSFELVRKDFWLVAWVLGTLQVIGTYLSEGIEHMAGEIFSDAKLVEVIAGAGSSVLLEPLFAVAAVLLAMRLAGLKAPDLGQPRA